MIYSIYRITNKSNDKCYIGYTENPTRRWSQHKTCSNRLYRPLYNAIRKYGIDNFEFQIIYQSYDEKHTKSIMEPYFVEKYNSYNKGYNCTKGGDDNNTEEKRAKTSKRMKENNPMKPGMTNSGSFKLGVSTPNTKEQNQKISKALTGSGNGNYGKPETAERINKKVTCPHCGTTTNLGNAKRWHFDNCKQIN